MVLIVNGFAAAILGGLTRPVVALVGGLLLGVTQSLIAGYGGGAHSSEVALGADARRHDLAGGAPAHGGGGGMRRDPLAIAAVAAVALALPAVLRGQHLSVYILMGLAALVTIGLSLLMGYAGQVSLGQAAFTCVGAYTAGLLAVHGAPTTVGLVAAPVVAALVGALVGVPLLRLRGHALAFATLAVQLIRLSLLSQADWAGGAIGLQGIPQLSVAGHEFTQDRSYAYLTWAAVAALLLLSYNIVGSRAGRGLRAAGHQGDRRRGERGAGRPVPAGGLRAVRGRGRAGRRDLRVLRRLPVARLVPRPAVHRVRGDGGGRRACARCGGRWSARSVITLLVQVLTTLGTRPGMPELRARRAVVRRLRHCARTHRAVPASRHRAGGRSGVLRRTSTKERGFPVKVDLTGRVVIVTGAGRGLGLAYAQGLASAGASVVVNDADPDTAGAAVEAIVAGGGTAVAAPGAVGPTGTAEELVAAAVRRYGRLDVLVANAGVLRDRMLWKMSDDDFDTVIDVHLRGTFTCARAAVRQLREQGEGGRIVLVGSPAGQRGNIGQTNYSAAKAAIVAMARTWSMECARAGITVNAVIPVAATAMTETMPAFAPYIQAWQSDGTPFPGWLRAGEGFGVPDDAAGLVVFLASAASGGVTGQAIGVGGDRLSVWAHPREVAVAYQAGGWAPEAIAGTWAAGLGRHAQDVGIPAPASPPAPESGGVE